MAGRGTAVDTVGTSGASGRARAGGAGVQRGGGAGLRWLLVWQRTQRVMSSSLEVG